MIKHYTNYRSYFTRLLILVGVVLSGYTTVLAQTYVNGNAGTSATNNNGVAAPAGTIWHELQNEAGNTTESNGSLGVVHVFLGVNNFTLADDFTVPAGQTWTVSKLRIYAIDQVTNTTTSPYSNIRVRIYSGVPGAGGTVVFGDMTTNRFNSTGYANLRAIFNSRVPTPGVPNPNLPVFYIDANINTALTAGTYWVEWQVVNTAATFSLTSQTVGIRALPGFNARQSNAGTWAALVDGGSPATAADVAIDLPFSLTYATGPCSGTPTPGNTISSAMAVCGGIPFNLTLQNLTLGTGITYQWQSSASATGPWIDITGATNDNLNTSLSTATTFYRAVVTCVGNSGNSTPVQVTLNPQSACYCAAGATSTLFEKISRVQYANINRASTATAGYENFITDTATVQRQNPVPITVTISNPDPADRVMVWIDLNQNGTFTDAGELLYTSPTGVGPHIGNIVVPATATLGYTRMRVRMYDTSLGPNATPCGNSSYGQVEDYTVNITPCVPVTVSAQPVNATIQCGSNATFSLAATGTGLTYQWQKRNSATSPWENLTNGGIYGGATTNALVITAAPVSTSGYQYRVIYAGGCSGTDFSNIVTLVVNPLVALVTPTSGNLCIGGNGQQITITNVAASTTVVFNSAAAVPIPDDFPAGVLIPITVSGIPAGSNISEVKVTLNASHTYVGDLEINLIAPNSGNLNLVGELDGGTGSNSSDNFVNTIISSLGTTPLSGAPAPRTGTFKADALAGYGPAGNEQNTTTWNALTSIPNGVWRLGASDWYAGDVGIVTSWSISITYGAPATGVFSPNAGLFTDAAYTIPYTGTAVSTVYAKPTVNTNYSVVVTTPICVSSPTIIPFTVNNSITGTSTTANAATCVGGNARFTASAPLSGNTIQHQWKVSTDAGATFTNVANGGVYSGATTATLNITGATATMNGYRFKDSLYVTVCNSSVNTNAATLRVNPLPVLVLSANPLTAIYPGQTTTLTVASSTTVPDNGYTWFRDGVLVPRATANTLMVDVDGLGVYTAAVIDANGCTSTSSSITIRDAPNDILFIYPSPNTGQFQVRYFSGSGNNPLPRVLNVYDNKGTRVFTKTYTINVPYTRLEVDLSNHGKGIYNVELSDANGRRLKTGRVIIL